MQEQERESLSASPSSKYNYSVVARWRPGQYVRQTLRLPKEYKCLAFSLWYLGHWIYHSLVQELHGTGVIMTGYEGYLLQGLQQLPVEVVAQLKFCTTVRAITCCNDTVSNLTKNLISGILILSGLVSVP